MSSVNKIILLGRVGSEPKKLGDKGIEFSIATSEKYVDKEGAKVEKTTWHKCKMWGNMALKVGSYIEKGKMLYIEGRQEHDEKDGKWYSSVNVSAVQLL